MTMMMMMMMTPEQQQEEEEQLLVIQYLPLVDTHLLHIKLRYPHIHFDADDLYSDLSLALLMAIRSYCPYKNTTLKSWIITYFRGYVKHFFRDNRAYLNTYQFLDNAEDVLWYNMNTETDDADDEI